MKKYINLALILSLCVSLVGCNGSKSDADLSAEQSVSNPLSELLADSNKPAVIKFHAEWCSTCKSYAPRFEAAKEEFEGKVDFYDIDVDDSRYKSLIRYGKISRIPDTFFVSSDRQNVSRKLGSIPRTQLLAIISSLLNN